MIEEDANIRTRKANTPLTEDAISNPGELSLDSLEESPKHPSPEEKRAAREKVAGRVRLLWNRRQHLLRLTCAGLVLSTLVAFLIPKRFESTAHLMPPDQTNSGMGMLAAAASGRTGSGVGSGLVAGASDFLGLKSTGALFIGILQSRTVQDDIINKFDLRKIYGTGYLRDARKALGDNTAIAEDRKSGIITIQVTDRNPQQAAAMAQEYVEELNRVVTQLNTSSAHRERVFLEERLAQVKLDLESAEKGFSEFASKNTAIDIQTQGKAMIEAASALEGQLIAAQTELQGLKQIYTDGNVRVRAAQARIDELQWQIQKLGGKFDAVPDLKGQNNQSMYPSIRQLPLLGVSYADLYRNTKVQEAVFETLTQEYELAKVQEAKETPSVKVIDPPDVPEWKSFPPRLMIMLVGTMVAMLIGIVWIFADDLWEKTDPQDPQKVLALEIYHEAKAHLPWESQSGFAFGIGSASRRLWRRLYQGQLNRQE